jgi:hypothetical protein
LSQNGSAFIWEARAVSVKEAILRGKADTVHAAAQAWSSNGHGEEDAADLGEAITISTSLSEELAALVDRRLRELSDGKLEGEVAERGEVLRTLIEAARVSLDVISGVALDAKGGGQQTAWAARLADAKTRIASIAERLRRRWPFSDPDKRERSRREHAAGQSRSIEEILGERLGAQDDRSSPDRVSFGPFARP